MYGYDISSYQSSLNVNYTQGDFVIVKATEGTSYTNPYFYNHANQALAAGKALGVYCYSDGLNYKAEVDYFVKQAKQYIGKAIFILDFEDKALYNGAGYAKQWLDYLQSQINSKPMIYMMLSAENNMNWSNVANQYPLWIAQYNNYNATGYLIRPLYGSLRYWKNYTIFQYSSSGRVNGYNGNLDINYSPLTKGQWNSLANSTNNNLNNGDDGDMNWHPEIKYNEMGRVRINNVKGAGLYKDSKCSTAYDHRNYNTEYTFYKVENGAFLCGKLANGKEQWFSGTDVIAKYNPLYSNLNANTTTFKVVDKNTYTQNTADRLAGGVQHLGVNKYFHVFGRIGKYLIVSSNLKDGKYVDAEKGLIIL